MQFMWLEVGMTMYYPLHSCNCRNPMQHQDKGYKNSNQQGKQEEVLGHVSHMICFHEVLYPHLESMWTT